MKTTRDALTVFRVMCQGKHCTAPQALKSLACIRLLQQEQKVLKSGQDKPDRDVLWFPSAGETETCARGQEVEWQVTVREIVWMQPFVYQNATYLLAQAVVSTQSPFRGKPVWLSRILIFQVEG